MKNKIITITLSVVLLFLFVINIFSPNKELSYSERRKLAQFPKFSVEDVKSGELMKDFDDYALDQFAFRNQFRSLKAFVDLKILNKKDNNDIYNSQIFSREDTKTLNFYKLSELKTEFDKILFCNRQLSIFTTKLLERCAAYNLYYMLSLFRFR